MKLLEQSKMHGADIMTHRRLITLGAPSPVMALPIKHI